MILQNKFISPKKKQNTRLIGLPIIIFQFSTLDLKSNDLNIISQPCCWSAAGKKNITNCVLNVYFVLFTVSPIYNRLLCILLYLTKRITYTVDIPKNLLFTAVNNNNNSKWHFCQIYLASVAKLDFVTHSLYQISRYLPYLIFWLINALKFCVALVLNKAHSLKVSLSVELCVSFQVCDCFSKFSRIFVVMRSFNGLSLD